MPAPSWEELKQRLAQFFATHSTDTILDTPTAPPVQHEPDTYMGGLMKGLYNEFVRPATSATGVAMSLGGPEGETEGLGELAGKKLSKAEFATQLVQKMKDRMPSEQRMQELLSKFGGKLAGEKGEVDISLLQKAVDKAEKEFQLVSNRLDRAKGSVRSELGFQFDRANNLLSAARNRLQEAMSSEKGEVSLKPLADLVKLVKGQAQFRAPAMKAIESALRAGEGTEANWEPLSKYSAAFGDDPEDVLRFSRMWGATSPNTPVARNNYEAIRARLMSLAGDVPFTRQNTLANDITMVNSKYPNLNRAQLGIPLSSIRGLPGKTEAMSRLVAGVPDTPDNPALPLDVQALSGVGAAEDNITSAMPKMRLLMSQAYKRPARSFSPEEVYKFSAGIYRDALQKLGGDFPTFWEGVKKLKGQGQSSGIVPWLKRWGLLDPGEMNNPEALSNAVEHVDRSEFYGKKDPTSVYQSGRMGTGQAISDIVSKTSSVDEKGQAGVTYNLYHGDLAGSPRFAVAAFPERSVTVDGAPSQKAIGTFISKNMDLLEDPENSVGTWYDKRAGNFVLDIVKTLDKKADALTLGAKTNQKAIFDLGKMQDIWLDSPESVATQYATSKGMPAPEPHEPVKANPDFGKRVADFFESMKSTPEDPEVAKAYGALKSELGDQFQALTKAGVKVEPWTKEGQPYANSQEMFTDITKGGHLYYFPTAKGFGEAGGQGHPLLDVDPNSGLPYNDILRAVHDYLAHGLGGHQFGPSGEENAFLEHIKLLSPDAARALATETRGQNSWVNFGPHMRDAQGNVLQKGQPGFKGPQERPFAEQKAGLMPMELTPEIQALIDRIKKLTSNR